MRHVLFSSTTVTGLPARNHTRSACLPTGSTLSDMPFGYDKSAASSRQRGLLRIYTAFRMPPALKLYNIIILLGCVVNTYTSANVHQISFFFDMYCQIYDHVI